MMGISEKPAKFESKSQKHKKQEATTHDHDELCLRNRSPLDPENYLHNDRRHGLNHN